MFISKAKGLITEFMELIISPTLETLKPNFRLQLSPSLCSFQDYGSPKLYISRYKIKISHGSLFMF